MTIILDECYNLFHDEKDQFGLEALTIINEDMEKLAIDELARLVQEPRVLNNIKRYVEQGKFPWETVNG